MMIAGLLGLTAGLAYGYKFILPDLATRVPSINQLVVNQSGIDYKIALLMAGGLLLMMFACACVCLTTLLCLHGLGFIWTYWWLYLMSFIQLILTSALWLLLIPFFMLNFIRWLPFS